MPWFTALPIVCVAVLKNSKPPLLSVNVLPAAIFTVLLETLPIRRLLIVRSLVTGIDPTPAPLGEVSIGRAIESFVGGAFGSSGTMTAAGIITRAVQSVQVKRIGYSGLMVPVLEDHLLAKRWAEGTYSMDSLLAYSAVCAGGLDTVPLPGDTSEEKIARIIGDVASLAWKWQKPLAARLLPVPGRKAGDMTEFDDPRMVNTKIR